MRGFARGGAGSGAAAAAAAPPQPTPQPLLAATAVAVAPARGAPCAGGWRTARMETSAGAGAAGTVVEKQQQRPPKRKRRPRITVGFLKQLVQEAVPGADTIEAALEVYVFTYGGHRGLLDHVDAVDARKGPLNTESTSTEGISNAYCLLWMQHGAVECEAAYAAAGKNPTSKTQNAAAARRSRKKKKTEWSQKSIQTLDSLAASADVGLAAAAAAEIKRRAAAAETKRRADAAEIKRRAAAAETKRRAAAAAVRGAAAAAVREAAASAEEQQRRRDAADKQQLIRAPDQVRGLTLLGLCQNECPATAAAATAETKRRADATAAAATATAAAAAAETKRRADATAAAAAVAAAAVKQQLIKTPELVGGAQMHAVESSQSSPSSVCTQLAYINVMRAILYTPPAYETIHFSIRADKQVDRHNIHVER